MRQLYFSMLDLELHHEYAGPGGGGDGGDGVLGVMRRVAHEYSPRPPLDCDRFLCSFMHIFGGGYAAGYYSYKWAEVLSADAFGAFEEAGLDNSQAIEAAGRRFRATVLAMGGSRHPMQVFKQFRGSQENHILH